MPRPWQQLMALLVATAAPLAAADCPNECTCELPDVYCSRAGFTDFPDGLDNETTFLDVGHNNISFIRDDAFVALGLLKLHVLVADNNSIEVVEPDAFRGLEQLRFVHLSGNLLTFLPRHLFRHNPSILHIDLTGNALAIPSDGPFLTAPPLEWLELDYCHLTELSNSTFVEVPKLRFLNLSNNSLKSLHVSVLRKLTYMRYFKMSGNPFHCDCTLKRLSTWLQQNNIKTDASCATPAEHKGKSWSVLKNLTCTS